MTLRICTPGTRETAGTPGLSTAQRRRGGGSKETGEQTASSTCAWTDLHRVHHFYVGESSESQALTPELQRPTHYTSWNDGFGGQLDRPMHMHKSILPEFAIPPAPSEASGLRPSLSHLSQESDFMSAASSRDQQNSTSSTSSTNQYFQVTHSQPKFPRSMGQFGRRKAISRQELTAGLNDLICSNV